MIRRLLAVGLWVGWMGAVMPIACALTVTDRISDAVEPYFERRAIRRRMGRQR